MNAFYVTFGLLFVILLVIGLNDKQAKPGLPTTIFGLIGVYLLLQGLRLEPWTGIV